MDVITRQEHATLRDLILQRLKELRMDIHEAEETKRAIAENAPHDVTDRKDAAAQDEFTARDEAQEQRDIDEARELEAALQRLDSNTYGNCADCGEPIAAERLRALPAALRCTRCQGLFERPGAVH